MEFPTYTTPWLAPGQMILYKVVSDAPEFLGWSDPGWGLTYDKK